MKTNIEKIRNDILLLNNKVQAKYEDYIRKFILEEYRGKEYSFVLENEIKRRVEFLFFNQIGLCVTIGSTSFPQIRAHNDPGEYEIFYIDDEFVKTIYVRTFDDPGY